jgi:hypothetical protein
MDRSEISACRVDCASADAPFGLIAAGENSLS